MSIRDEIAQRLTEAVEEARRQDLLPAATLPPAEVERPQSLEHGDFATSLPLRLARAARMSPMEIAELLVPLIPSGEAIERVWAAPPGFVNFALTHRWLQQQVETINEAGSAYGDTGTGAGERVQVEFVSVNPTGPIHVGHARGGPRGRSVGTGRACPCNLWPDRNSRSDRDVPGLAAVA